jgi:large exoprotein involved in heme utilization and adhesion
MLPSIYLLARGKAMRWLGFECRSLLQASCVLAVLFSTPVNAQIEPDATLGRESSVVTERSIRNLPSTLIEGGAIRGRNLFHSFREFNVGEGADIWIEARDLVLKDRGVISLATYGSGNSGDLAISTRNSVSVLGGSPTLTTYGSAIFSLTVGSGNAGNIFLETGSLVVQDGGLFFSSTASEGNGGRIDINALSIKVLGFNPANGMPSTISAATGGAGNGGDIVLNTKLLEILDGGRIDSSTLANGAAGTIEIDASDAIVIAGRGQNALAPSQIISSGSNLHPIFSQLLNFPAITGSSGSVTIATNRLTVAEGGRISVGNDGTGVEYPDGKSRADRAVFPGRDRLQPSFSGLWHLRSRPRTGATPSARTGRLAPGCVQKYRWQQRDYG